MRVEVGRWVSANRRTFAMAWSSARRTRGSSASRAATEVVGVEDEATVGPTAADARVRVADRVVAAGPDVGERGPGARRGSPRPGPRRAGRGRRARATASGSPAATAAEVEAAQADASWRSRDDLLDRQHEDARRAGGLEPRQQAPDLVRADDRVDGDHALVGERDDRRRLEGRAGGPRARAASRPGRSSSGTCDRARR